MSASAEVYISVDTPSTHTRDGIEEAIRVALCDLGFDSTNNERYQVGRYQSGLIVEAKSYWCAWKIFEEDWAEKLVRHIAVLDEAADVELYVYNLDREADLVMRTSMLFSENYMERAAL